MINEECLARPTWEMAHLQTQVRRRAYKPSACVCRQLPTSQASSQWQLGVVGEQPDDVLGGAGERSHSAVVFFPEMFTGDVNSVLVLEGKNFLFLRFVDTLQSFLGYVGHRNKVIYTESWFCLKG